MSTASIGKSVIAAAALTLAVIGFNSSIRHERANAQAGLSSADATRDGPRTIAWYEAQPNVLRARLDGGRGRMWVLHADGVDLYVARSDKKLRSIALPEWIWARDFHPCPPAFAIGPGGDVLVSSNVLPVIWRIDARTFQVSRHELEVVEDKGREFGFSGLRYLSRVGAYAAVNGIDGSLWRIDASLTRAELVSLFAPAGQACEAHPVSLHTHF
jgi:hypothetical protein